MVEIKLPKYVESILETLNEFGYASYVVGGAVRDALVGNEPKDWDIATDATPDQVEEIFAQTIPTPVVLAPEKVKVSFSENCWFK